MLDHFLDFEKPIMELEGKIAALRLMGADGEVDVAGEIARLQAKSRELTISIFKNLTAWQIAQLARHPLRPYSLDYIRCVFTDFDELHGDRAFGDDEAIVGGTARFMGQSVMIIAHQKGRDVQEKLRRSFGMPHPEGYRRARRLMEQAEKFKLPIISLIDTPGAYPGVGAEARGQSEAIARNLWVMAQLRTPIICVVIGEGCSGGALGIGVGDCIMALQYSYYATISPEGCATILWKDAGKAAEAAEIMGIVPTKLLERGLIDRIIEEPVGGAHRDLVWMSKKMENAISEELRKLQSMSLSALVERRYQRLMALK